MEGTIEVHVGPEHLGFSLVVLACVPAAIPFLLFDNARFAVRVSNAILLALLFVVGCLWARFTLGNYRTA